jgi:hypothetical protein
MSLISGARLHLINSLGSDKIQEQLRTLSTYKMTLQFEMKYSTQGSGVKDRIGDQRGGSEWEPIKILLEGD